MSPYIRLADLAGLRDAQPTTPDQMDKAAAGMEATAKALRAANQAATATALESQARQLRQQAASTRAMLVPNTVTPSQESSRSVTLSTPVVAMIAVGVVGLSGLAGVAIYRSVSRR